MRLQRKETKIQNPITLVKKKIEKKRKTDNIEKEKEYWADVFENLENYDGSAESQKEVRNVDERY